MDQEARSITITPETTKPTARVIFLHGLGDTASGWFDGCYFLAERLPHVEFLLPTANNIPVTLNNYMTMPAWYDLAGLGSRADEKCEGLDETRDRVLSFVPGDSGIPRERTILAGFSQGGAVSLFSGLQDEGPAFAGVLAMSGYLPRPAAFVPSNPETPVLMCHGDCDQVVALEWAKESEATMIAAGMTQLEFKTYDGLEHSASLEELNDVAEWLKLRIPDES